MTITLKMPMVEFLLRQLLDKLERMEQKMAAIDDRLAALKAEEDAFEAADAAALARLEAKITAGQTLTPDEVKEFDDLEARIKANTEAAAKEGV